MAEDSIHSPGGPESENDGADRHLPVARVRATPWRGWVWSVPLAAMILLGFLAIRTWLFWGPTVTVTFPAVHGLNPNGTSVFYKGVRIGSLQTVELANHGHSVKATLAMVSDVSDLLRKGTEFWIRQPNIFSGDLAAVISGPEIEMIPGHGPTTDKFQGLLHRPDIQPNLPGTTFIVDAHRLGNLHHGSKVLYHGLVVGELLGWSYNPKRNDIQLKVFVRTPFDRRVSGRVRFWRKGIFNLRFQAGGLHINLPPLASILQGAIAFDTARGAPPASRPAAFRLYSSRTMALRNFSGPSAIFAAHFTGSAAGLHVGAPVNLDGMPVGQVRSTRLQYNPERHSMRVSVTFALYPNRFGIHAPARQPQSTIAAFDKMLAQLVGRGLRAQLNSSNPLLGGQHIALVVAGKPGSAVLNTSEKIPEIPTVSGSSLSGLIASLKQITEHANKIPLEEIGQNLKNLSARLNALAASPEIRKSLDHLDKTLANAQVITGNARGQVEPTITSLRHAADAAATMATTITRITGGAPQTQADVQNLVAELTRTARAIRTLANYLDRHPEALIQGRSK